MKIFRWLAVSFSMYSRIPMPVFSWAEEDVSHSLLFFPLVGVVIGGLVFLLNALPFLSALPVAVRILLTLALPLIVTGGFHADGFMDTEDALHSGASVEKKLEVLKDPHIGAFAVLALVKWTLVYAAAVTLLLLNENCDLKVLLIFCLIFVVSRCFSGLTSLLLKKARTDGMLYAETRAGTRGTMLGLFVQLAAAIVLMVILHPLCGAVTVLMFVLYLWVYRYRSYRAFGGVTGDTAGFFLTTGEILAAAALAVTLYLF